ncbi:putative L-asparaginase [Commensalibacter sp. Nvir]|uniref:asparaginase n=1 Tax=Commensalibacter sp. Nvir TaxID=3069817 RepID=UPI002D2CFEDB|nr:putative L-asparaginase [Commensalibacter sp. Nvir]
MYHSKKIFLTCFTSITLVTYAFHLAKAQPASSIPSKSMTYSHPNKVNVLVLTTGGTIAGKENKQGLDYRAGQTSGEDLVASVPALKKEANLTVKAVAQIGSQDMNDKVIVDLAKEIKKAESDPKVSGIVITHGTDTMEETAFFLNQVLPHRKPIVLVGSMRPADAVSADGAGNLLDAVRVAANPEARNRPVMIVMNNDIISAQFAQKTNSTSVQTFKAPLSGPIGTISNNHVYFFSPPPMETKAAFAIPSKIPFPRVDIIYSHIQMDSGLIEDSVKRGARGIILAGVGNGNTSAEAISALEKASKKGVIVVRSTRVGNGFVNRNVEVNDDTYNFVVSEYLNPQKSRILLQILLANAVNTTQEIQKQFSKLY